MFRGHAIFLCSHLDGNDNFFRFHFENASFEKNLMLDGARIQVMRLTNASFKGQILPCNSDFGRLEVRWSALQKRLVYDGVVYLSLAKNFRNLEWFEDADECYYCYRRLSQSEKSMYSRDGKLNWSKMLDALASVSCSHGVASRVCFHLQRPSDLPVRHPLLGGRRHNCGAPKWYPVGMYRYLATVESVLGWLLMALFLVTLRRTMIR